MLSHDKYFKVRELLKSDVKLPIRGKRFPIAMRKVLIDSVHDDVTALKQYPNRARRLKINPSMISGLTTVNYKAIGNLVTKIDNTTQGYRPYKQYEKNRPKQVGKLVFVVDHKRNPLSPTNQKYASKLLASGRAVEFQSGHAHSPYAIQLTCTKPKYGQSVRLSVELKLDETLKISVIVRKAKSTIVYPQYFSKDTWSSTGDDKADLANFVASKVAGIYRVATVSDIEVVYQFTERFNQLDRVSRRLKDSFSSTLVSQRTFLKKTNWHKRQEVKKSLKRFRHELGSLFFGYYDKTYESLGGVSTVNEYSYLCGQFVTDVYYPLLDSFRKHAKLPDKILFMSEHDRVREVFCLFFRGFLRALNNVKISEYEEDLVSYSEKEFDFSRLHSSENIFTKVPSNF